MPPPFDPLSLWAVLRIQDSFFAAPCDNVQSILALTEITPIPNLPHYMRGLINHQGQPVCLIDLRKRLGIPSLKSEIDEFTDLMDAREQDHIHWLNTLQACINEGKRFTLATDPRQCKFGQWYYKTLPEIKDGVLKAILENFEKPHNSIHNLAVQVEKLVAENLTEEACQLIASKKNHELRRMIDLFSDAKKIYRSHHQEIAVILKNQRLFGLIVDEVVNISNLSWAHWQAIEEMMSSDEKSHLILGMAETLEQQAPVAILNLSQVSA